MLLRHEKLYKFPERNYYAFFRQRKCQLSSHFFAHFQLWFFFLFCGNVSLFLYFCHRNSRFGSATQPNGIILICAPHNPQSIPFHYTNTHTSKHTYIYSYIVQELPLSIVAFYKLCMSASICCCK